MRFKDKTVLISGASRGINQACAERFAAEGAKVILVQRSPSEDYACIQADLSQPEQCGQVVEQALQINDRLDVLVI